jgi:hypothetical protein
MPLDQVTPLVKRALAVLSEREVSPQLGLLKSTLLQLDSTFSERNYGAGSFRDFVEKLAKTGVLTVYQGKGGWLVSPADGQPAVAEPASDDDGPARPAAPAHQTAPAHQAAPAHHGAPPAPIATIGTMEDGLSQFRTILGAAEIRRWPMYLRNIKQIFRQVSPVFDERAYGYASLVDLLRAAQKDGLVRLERDRQGVVRVFQGGAEVPRPASVPERPREPDAPAAAAAAEPAEAADPDMSTGPGNSIADPPPVLEVRRRRPKPAAGRTASPAPRRTRKKTT